MSAFDIESEILVTVSGEKSLNQLAAALEKAGVEAADVETAVSLAAEEMIRAGNAANQYAKAVKQVAASYREMGKYSGKNALSGLDSKTSGDVKASASDMNASDAALRKVAVAQEKQLAAVVRETAKAEREKEAAAKRANAESARSAKQALAAERQLASEQERRVNETINARYALYDTAAAYSSIAIAAGAVQAITVGIYASQEQAFASVRRTTGAAGDELKQLKSDLMELSTQIPETFENIAGVSTIGAQLGVANDDLTQFTKTVTMFSAATGVTVDETAMSVGRLAQLTGTAGADYERLASTIYQTGVTAVATEGEILAVASEIATAGDLAGLSADQIVALSSSLASLGVAPEGARGSIMRLFGEFDKAISNGGAKLENFARISGTTADEFSNMWQNSPQQAISSFLQGLESINNAGGSLKSTLRDVGIVNVRDEKLVSLLANNYEVYAQALDETGAAWQRGTDLSKGFGEQTDNLIDQFTILKNNLAAMSGEMGEWAGEALKVAIKGVIDFLEAIRGIANIAPGVTKALGLILTVLAGGVTVFATYRIAVSLLQGNLAALATAKYKLAGASQGLNMKLGTLVKTYAQVMMGNQAATAKVLGLNTALNAQAGAAAKANGSLAATGATTASTGAKFAGLAGKLVKGATGFGLALLAIEALTAGYEKLHYALLSDADQFREQFGDTSGLAEAIAKDTAAVEQGAKSYRAIVTEASAASQANKSYADSGVGIQSMQNLIKQGVDGTNTSVATQTKYLGDNAAAWITQTMTANEKFRTLWQENGKALTQAGFSLDTYFQKLIDGTADNYLADFVAKQKAELDAATLAWDGYRNQAQLGTEVDEQASKAALDRYDTATATYKVLGTFTDLQKDLNGAIEEEATASEIATAANKAAGVEINNLTEDTQDYADTLKDAIADMYAMYDAPAATQAALEALGKSLYENGNSFSQFSESGRANMEALAQTVNAMAAQAGDDNAAFVGGIINMISALQQQGVIMGEEFDWLFAVLNNAAGNQYGVNFSTQAARENIRKLLADHAAMVAALRSQQVAAIDAMRTTQDAGERAYYDGLARSLDSQIYAAETAQKTLDSMGSSADSTFKSAQGIANGYNNAARSAAKTAKATKDTAKNAKDAAKEVRTFADYASDVASAFDRAIQIRFGVRNAKADLKAEIKDIIAGIENEEWPSIDELLMSTKSLRKTFFHQVARDSIGDMFAALKKEAAEAKQAVRDAMQAVRDSKAELTQLKADEGSLKFWRAIALEAGNMERVAQIDAQLAENRANQAETTSELADNERELAAAREAANNKSLTDNSEQGRANRDNVRGLVGEYMEYIQALKESGASQETIDKAIADASRDFMAQGQALGYSATELQSYNDALLAMGAASTSSGLTSQEVSDALQNVAELYAKVAEEMLAAGYSQEEVDKFLAGGKVALENLGKQLGATPGQVKLAQGALDDFSKIIDKLPKNVNVSIKALTPGEAAVREFLAKYDNKTVNVKAQGTGSLQAPAGGWTTSPIGNVTANTLTAKEVATTDRSVDVQKAMALALELEAKAKKKPIPVKEVEAERAKLSKKFQNLGIPKATADKLAAKTISNAGTITTNAIRNYGKLSSDSASVAGAIKGASMRITGSVVTGASAGANRGVRWGGLADPRANLTYMAKGGSPIRGVSRGRDTVPIMMDAKEFIQPREAVSWYGLDFMEAIQNRTFPKEFQIPIISTPVQPQNDGVQLVEILPNQLTSLAHQIAAVMPAGISPADITHAVNSVNAGQTGKGKG